MHHDALTERAAWRALERALAAGTLHLSLSTDDGEDRFAGTYLRAGRPVAASGRTLADVILELTGKARVKHCGRCRRDLPVGRFSLNASMPDGRCRACRDCETARLRRHKATKRKAGAAPG